MVLAAMGMALVGCGSGDDPALDDALTTTTTSTPTTSSTVAPPASTTTTTTTTTTSAPAGFDHAATLMGRSFGEKPGRWVEFERRPDGDIVRWSGGCNITGGPVTVTADRLEVTGDGGSTAGGCDDDRLRADEEMAAFMRSVPAWRLEGDVLVLTVGQDTYRLSERR